MVKSIDFGHNGTFKAIAFEEKEFTVFLDSLVTLVENTTSFDLRFELDKPITKVRNHAYEWEELTADFIANEFHPKIVQLVDGTYLQSNITSGIWEVNKENASILLWRFNPLNSDMITEYTGPKRIKTAFPSNHHFTFQVAPSLVWSKTNAIEFSRSKIPFSAVICFTDHCDFDTPQNTKIQREFFKSVGVKISKGFFLNHFSKREDNLSFEREPEELVAWKVDGHELCYHSLSQSIKPDEDSINDFIAFEPPFSFMPTWIDHGEQRYNLSFYKNRAIMDDAQFSTIMKKKGITTFWNYIDSGVAVKGVINQGNPKHFTLENYYKGIGNHSYIERIGMMIKMIFFYHYAVDSLISNYQQLAAEVKKVIFKRNLKAIPRLLKKAYSLLIPISKVIFSWKTQKKKPFKTAKYATILFKHFIDGNSFYLFQTIEMNDFINGLHPSNIDLLIEEKGICIAHTYFSLPIEYHKGRLFTNDNQINQVVAANFNYLSKKIKDGSIWNPTINELVSFMSNFESAFVDVDENGVIFVITPTILDYRTVH